MRCPRSLALGDLGYHIFTPALRRLTFIQQHCVNVPFKMIDGDQRQSIGKSQSLGISNANQQRPGQPGTVGNGDSIQIGQRDSGLGQRGPHHRNDSAKMLAAGQLRHHPAVTSVRGNLRRNHRAERARPPLDDRSRSLVAGGFNAEDQAAGTHLFSLPALECWASDRLLSNKAMFPGSRQFEAALQVVKKLRAAGHEAYLAGGCVRDLLLGREPKDYDVATSATPDAVLNLFKRTFAVGAHFGVVLVADGATCGGADAACAAGDERDEKEYLVTEVATFRSDGAYSDGRHPNEVRYTRSAEEDVRRRDFTINGLLLDPLQSANDLRESVIDYVGGVADLDAGVIRAIGRPEARFEEDRLRMLRGVRFAARFGYELEPATAAAMRRLAVRIHAVSRERVRDELTKMLTEGHARRAFELLEETGLLSEVLPEIARMKGVEQPPQFHPEGDVWTHTLLLLNQLEAGCPLTLAWGALLHDVGKPPTFRRAPDRIRFDGHVDVGVGDGGGNLPPLPIFE